MLHQLALADWIVLTLLLLVTPAAGIWVALQKKNAEQYFLAGRNIRWWTVAGSIFGTNISSFHLIGMLGVGYSIGFVQTHYELVAIGILLICYVFLASYRRLGLFTLSQYLEIRYNATARLAYTILLVLIILVQLVGAFYVGSITLQWLFSNGQFQLDYTTGLLLIGLITCSYTIWGGMDSIVITDSIQTVMMLAAGLTVAYCTFSQPEIGGFSGLLALDAAQATNAQKMHLYLPPNHPTLPWTGVFTGLMLQHCFNFSTNQFLVQRALAASTDEDARKGIIASGWLKLTIPFFSIATGIAAYYLFKARLGDTDFNADTTFLNLVAMVIPVGIGLTGMILAGLTAATFSSVDSMMNAATTLLTVDIYQKYINPDASDHQLLRFGRLTIVLMVVAAILVAQWTYTPDRSNNFFLRVSAQLSYFTPGITAAFFLGIFHARVTARGAVAAMLLSPIFGWSVEILYPLCAQDWSWLGTTFGLKLNFLHRIALTFGFAALTMLGTSGTIQPGYTTLKIAINWPVTLRWIGLFAAVQLFFGGLAVFDFYTARALAPWAAAATLAVFIPFIRQVKRPVWTNDRFYAGLLVAATIWIYYFFA
jgi:solute:Na+ symporter, SSS family